MSFKMDMSKFKKVKSDKDHTVLKHEDGHEIRINHSALSKANRNAISKLPAHKPEVKMAEGGDVIPYDKLIPEEQARKAAEDTPFGVPPASVPATPIDFNAAQPPSTSPMDAPSGTVPDNQVVPPMPTQAQAPAAPTSPQAPSQGLNPSQPQPGIIEGYGNSVRGSQGEAVATQQLAQEREENFKAQASALQNLKEDYDTHFQEVTKDYNEALQHFKDGKVDPSRYMGRMDTGQKMDTAIGLILGGLGGGGNGNAAQDFLNKQIDRDIEAQKSELGKRETLLGAAYKRFGNLKDSTDFTRMLMMGQLEASMKEAEARAQDPLAKARMQKEIGALQTQTGPLAQQLATSQFLRQGASSGGKFPASVRPEAFVASVVPKEHQEAVSKEIERATNTRQIADSVFKDYDRVVQGNKGVGRIGQAIYAPAELQALEAKLGTTVGDLEGTVRQTAMDNVKHAYLPRATDTPERAAARRSELAEYLKTKSAAVRAKGYGIDLDKFESTSRNDIGTSHLSPQDQHMLDLARQDPNHPNAQKIFRKLGIRE